jgi:ubiquinone/menaquinone biosynthesis C-methylase UbiE
MQKLEDTGERMVPELHKGRSMYGAHIARYTASLPFVTGKIALDIACGSGYGTKILASKAKKVYGVDIDEKTIKYAKEKYSTTNINYSVGSGTNIPIEDQSVDVVVSYETIEHIEDYKKFLKEIKRVLKPGGVLLLSTPNDAEYGEGNPYHVHEFFYDDLKKLIKKYFKHHKDYFQSLWVYSSILPKELQTTEWKLNIETISTVPVNPTRCTYFLLACSDNPIEGGIKPIGALGELYSQRELQKVLRENRYSKELKAKYDQEVLARQQEKAYLNAVISSPAYKAGRVLVFIPKKILNKTSALKRRGQLKKVLKSIYQINNNQKAIKVGILARNITRAPTSSAFLRLIGPLTYGETNKQISIKLLPENTTSISGELDLCIVQRTAFDDIETAKLLIEDIKNKNIKLVVDTDDAFAQLDKSHPQYEFQSHLVEALTYIKEAADRIWVSTAELDSEYLSKRTVYRNSLDERLWPIQQRPIFTDDNKIRAVYMGTTTHVKDFAMIFPALERINQKFNNSIELTVIGVASAFPERNWLKVVSPPDDKRLYPFFVRWFALQGPFDIGLAPLEESEFNKGKSDIKILDYLSTGVLPLVSNIGPYKNKELDDFVIRVGYGDNDWFDAFNNIYENRSKYEKGVKSRWQKLEPYLANKRSMKLASEAMLKEISMLTSGGEFKKQG